MILARAAALGLLVLSSVRALAQGSSGTDSLSSLTPAQRYSQICPGPRESGTGALIGRVRDIDDSTALGDATVRIQWIDLKGTKGHLSNVSTKTSGGGFYLLCGVPVQVRLNLHFERGGYVAKPAQATLDDGLIGNVDFMLRRMDRATGDTSAPTPRGAQKLAEVAIDEKAVLPSWMIRSGFDERRKQGLGAFVTEAEIAKHGYSELSSILVGVRGIHIDHHGGGGADLPFPLMLGISDANQVRCVPNVFLDGSPFPIARQSIRGAQAHFDAFLQLSAITLPERIKGIEVYSNPGTIPAQYDLTSSTGCGSIVIWTR